MPQNLWLRGGVPRKRRFGWALELHDSMGIVRLRVWRPTRGWVIAAAENEQHYQMSRVS